MPWLPPPRGEKTQAKAPVGLYTSLPRGVVMPCCCSALRQVCSPPAALCPSSLSSHFVRSKTQSWPLCVPVLELWELLLAAGERCDPSEHVAAASACQCACKGTALSVPGLKPPKSTFFFLSICHFSILCLRACAQ